MPHQIQTSRALVSDRHDTVACVVAGADGDHVDLATLTGRQLTVTVAEPDQLHGTLARPDLTRRDGRPLALVSVRYRLLAVAFGPAEAPRQFVVTGVLDIDSVPPVVPATADAQPSWACLDLVDEPAHPLFDVPGVQGHIPYTPGDPCPRCGSDRVVDIVYGLPDRMLFERSERGEVALGGCVIRGDDPTHRCLDCHGDLGSRLAR